MFSRVCFLSINHQNFNHYDQVSISAQKKEEGELSILFESGLPVHGRGDRPRFCGRSCRKLAVPLSPELKKKADKRK